MRSAPQDTHANCEARSSSTEHARKVKESRKENCTSRWRGRNAREAQDVWATCCLQVNLLLSNVFGFSPLSLSYSILFSLFVILFFPFPFLLSLFLVFEPLGLFIVKLFLCSSVFSSIPTLILSTSPEQNVWAVLGELVVTYTLTPTREHLPNSPYCTTHSWL